MISDFKIFLIMGIYFEQFAIGGLIAYKPVALPLIFHKIHRKTPVPESFLIKLQAEAKF